MKKAILLAMTTISFLIGCSFSENKQQKSELEENISNATSSIYDLVFMEDIQTVTKALNSISKGSLNTPNLEGKTLLEIALLRGNPEIAILLIKLGANPLITMSNGQSLYNSLLNRFEYSEISKVINRSSSGILKNVDATGEWSELIQSINNNQTPCDTVLAYILSIDHADRAMSLSNFLNKTPNCYQSLSIKKSSELLKQMLSDYFNSENVDLSEDLLSLIQVLPQQALMTKIELSQQKFFVHPLVIFSATKSLNERYSRVYDLILKSITQPNQTTGVEFKEKSSNSTTTISLEPFSHGKFPAIYESLGKRIIEYYLANYEGAK